MNYTVIHYILMNNKTINIMSLFDKMKTLYSISIILHIINLLLLWLYGKEWPA